MRETGQAKPAWVDLSDDDLLSWRIRDLGLRIEGTELEGMIEQLWFELTDRGIEFLPMCYLGDEWFCPDGVPIIAIPFYLAHPRLKQLEQHMILEVEGGTRDSCMRLLRHECGHAINYAYALHKKKKWRETFGSFSTEYPDTYRPQPYSKSFVRHLENWYAQYHPDEDFSETFAVWLDPNSNWKERYKGWKALAKLEYVDNLMKGVVGKEPRVSDGKRICEASKLTQKLSTYYSRKRREFAEEMPDFYDSDLRRIFTADDSANDSPPASTFLRHHRRSIVSSISRWTGEKRFTINRLINALITRCRILKLRQHRDEADTLVRVTACLTSMAMNYLLTGKLKRHP
jgi:hypothetical protein